MTVLHEAHRRIRDAQPAQSLCPALTARSGLFPHWCSATACLGAADSFLPPAPPALPTAANLRESGTAASSGPSSKYRPAPAVQLLQSAAKMRARVSGESTDSDSFLPSLRTILRTG